jgi:hypothetical protein
VLRLALQALNRQAEVHRFDKGEAREGGPTTAPTMSSAPAHTGDPYKAGEEMEQRMQEAKLAKRKLAHDSTRTVPILAAVQEQQAGPSAQLPGAPSAAAASAAAAAAAVAAAAVVMPAEPPALPAAAPAAAGGAAGGAEDDQDADVPPQPPLCGCTIS